MFFVAILSEQSLSRRQSSNAWKESCAKEIIAVEIIVHGALAKIIKKGEQLLNLTTLH